MGGVRALLIVAGVSIAACGPLQIDPETPSVPPRERALEIAKRCARNPPWNGVGHHGRALSFEQARVDLVAIDPSTTFPYWLVRVPESGPKIDAFDGVDVYVLQRHWTCNGVRYR